jgi:hypothetical protein
VKLAPHLYPVGVTLMLGVCALRGDDCAVIIDTGTARCGIAPMTACLS